MLDFLEGYMIIVLEIACCKIFFDTFCNRGRSEGCVPFLSLILLSAADFFIALFLHPYFFLKELLVVLSTTAAMRFYTQKPLRSNFVLSMIFQGILLITDYVTIIVKSIFFPGLDFTGAIAGTMLLLLDKIILFLIVVVIKRHFSQNGFEPLRDADWIRFLFFPIFTICSIIAMISNGIEYMPADRNTIFVFISLGLICMNMVFFYLLHDIALKEKELREIQAFELETKNKLHFYEALSQNMEKQRQLSHEYQNQMNLIQELCQKGRIRELEAYLTEINGELSHDMDCIDTHHCIINTIVNQKYYESMSKRIPFLCKINDMSALWLSNTDIALLLSNLLNNAIEACEQVKGEKYIKFKFLLDADKMILSVKNPYDGKIVKQGNQFETTKNDDSESHGYGLKNVIKVIEDNHGDYAIRTTKTEFYISICIPRHAQR